MSDPPVPDGTTVTTAAPVTESPPVDSEALAGRIVAGTLTGDEAARIWNAISDRPTRLRFERLDLFEEWAELCMRATTKIVTGDDPGQREALASLVRGDIDDAAARFESVIATPGSVPSHVLVRKAAIFTFVAPSIAVDALARACALTPGDRALHWSLGCLYEAGDDPGRAEASLLRAWELEVQEGATDDAKQSMARLAQVAATRGARSVPAR